MIDEPRYQHLVSDVFRRIEDALDDVEPEVVDVEARGDVLSLGCKNGVRIILNTQRPTRQIWLAARTHAWHFSLGEDGRWLDDKGRGDELFATVSRLLGEHAGVDRTI